MLTISLNSPIIVQLACWQCGSAIISTNILSYQYLISSFSRNVSKCATSGLEKRRSALCIYRPIYIGKNQNPKNLGFLLYRLHCQKKPLTFRVFGTKSACMREKTRISLCFGKWCVWATSLYLWPYTCSAHYVAGRGRVIPLKVTYHVTKNPNNTGEIGGETFTLAKNQWNFGGVFKKSRCGGGVFRFGFFWSV